MRAPRGSGLWTAVIVAAVALACAAAPPDAAAQDDACAGPRALVAEKKIEQAKTAYIALAGTKSAPPCAAAELALLETSAALATAAAKAAAEPKSCDGAKALLDAELYEEAEDAYAKLADGDDPPPCAAEGLKTTKAKIKDERTRAERAGDDADDAIDWLADWGKLALLVVAAIAILGAVALRFGPLATIGRKLTWWLSQPPLRHGLVRRAPRRFFRSLLAPVSWALATPIQIEPLTGPSPGEGDGDDDKGGGPMTRTITGLLPVVSARRMSGINVAIKPFAAESALKEVTDALSGTSQSKAAAAVLSILRRLVPRNRLHLTGTVLASKTRGKGLALEIVNDGGDVLDAATLWEKDLEPFLRSGSFTDDPEEDRTVRLGTAGAVWVLFAILRERRVLSDKGWQRLLGTRSWESYARSLIAVAEAGSRDETTTQAGHAHALEADPGNMTALFNLGQADVKVDDWDQAIDRLKQVNRHLPAREARVKVLGIKLWHRQVNYDPLRYQVAYGLAYATYMNAERDAEAARKQPSPNTTKIDSDLTKAIETARDGLAPHVVELEKAVMALDRRGGRPTRDHDDLDAQLRRFEGPLLTLWGYLSAKLSPNPTVSYATPKRKNVVKQLEGGNHVWVIQKFLPKQVSVGPKTTYNLASYYAVLGKLDVAWTKLEDSLDLGFLASDADKDEQLEPLRKDDADRFAKLIARFRADEPSGLGRYSAIGKRGADALKRASIETEAVFLERAHTRLQREQLARGQGVGLTLIDRWAHAADLGALLEVDQVNLLDAAGVSTHDLLVRMKPTSLSKLLEAIKPKPEADLPDVDELREWITRARLNPSKLREERPPPTILKS